MLMEEMRSLVKFCQPAHVMSGLHRCSLCAILKSLREQMSQMYESRKPQAHS